MSALGSVQKKMTDISHSGVIGRSLDPASTIDRATGANIMPHDAQYAEQEKQNKNATDLAAQQAADAAAAAEGSKPMAVRDQLYNSASAGDVMASGNETGTGEPLVGPRRRAARRVLVG
jgi:hypothetical protein